MGLALASTRWPSGVRQLLHTLRWWSVPGIVSRPSGTWEVPSSELWRFGSDGPNQNAKVQRGRGEQGDERAVLPLSAEHELARGAAVVSAGDAAYVPRYLTVSVPTIPACRWSSTEQ